MVDFFEIKWRERFLGLEELLKSNNFRINRFDVGAPTNQKQVNEISKKISIPQDVLNFYKEMNGLDFNATSDDDFFTLHCWIPEISLLTEMKDYLGWGYDDEIEEGDIAFDGVNPNNGKFYKFKTEFKTCNFY